MFGGETYDPELDEDRLKTQLGRVFNIMKDGLWRTLEEITRATGDPQASVSARLRDFRKPQFGEHTVEREREDNGLHRYRLVCGGKPISGLGCEEIEYVNFDWALSALRGVQTPHGLEFLGRLIRDDIESGWNLSDDQKQTLRDAYRDQMIEIKGRLRNLVSD